MTESSAAVPEVQALFRRAVRGLATSPGRIQKRLVRAVEFSRISDPVNILPDLPADVVDLQRELQLLLKKADVLGSGSGQAGASLLDEAHCMALAALIVEASWTLDHLYEEPR